MMNERHLGTATAVTLGLLAALAFSCGDISDTPGSGGRGGSAMTGGAGVGGGAGRGGMGGGGRGGAVVTADAGLDMGGAGGAQGGTTGLPSYCPTAAPIPAPNQVIAINSINFTSSEVVLKNVSRTSQTIRGGRQGWQWCNFPAYWNLILSETDVVLGPGETYAFIPINNTMGEWSFEREGGELGIISETGGFTTPDFYRAFVSWGETQPLREPSAVQGGYWTGGDRIEVAPGDAGFLLTGDASRAEGYTSVPAGCLVAPPNP
jgi:hypothetical protein